MEEQKEKYKSQKDFNYQEAIQSEDVSSETIEEMLIDITHKEEDARHKKESAIVEAKKMIDDARSRSRELELADKRRREEIFKEEVRKFESESKRRALEFLEVARKNSEKEILAPAANKLDALSDFLLDEFLSLKWFK